MSYNFHSHIFQFRVRLHFEDSETDSQVANSLQQTLSETYQKDMLAHLPFDEIFYKGSVGISYNYSYAFNILNICDLSDSYRSVVNCR